MSRMNAHFLMLCMASGLAANPSLKPGEGFISVTGGPVWYKVIGRSKGIPLLMVHGGPGGRSCRMEPAAELLGKDRPVILYDQLGGGRSGRPQDDSLWTIQRLAQELDQVRKALRLKKVHLLGHSCGTTILAEYLATHSRKGVVSVVMGSPAISTPLWLEDAAFLRAQLPSATQEALRKHEAAGTTDHADYRAAEAEYIRRFVMGEGIESPSACQESHFNQVIYKALWGPTEFHATGSLKSFDRTEVLPTLRMPVLYLCGRMDEVREETLTKMKNMTPGAAMHVFERSHHGAFIEEKENYADVVGAFLAGVESGRR